MAAVTSMSHEEVIAFVDVHWEKLKALRSTGLKPNLPTSSREVLLKAIDAGDLAQLDSVDSTKLIATEVVKRLKAQEAELKASAAAKQSAAPHRAKRISTPPSSAVDRGWTAGAGSEVYTDSPAARSSALPPRHVPADEQRPVQSGLEISGLPNHGTTCFLNALVQCLRVAWPRLINAIPELQNFSSQEGTLGAARALLAVAAAASGDHPKSGAPNTNFADGQHDPHELLLVLLAHARTIPDVGDVVAEAAFVTQETTTCDGCGAVVQEADVTEECGISTAVPPGMPLAVDQLIARFVEPEAVAGFIHKPCGAIAQGATGAHKKRQIVNPPRLLVVHANRDGDSSAVRLQSVVTFGGANYKLVAFTEHRGTRHGGHYWAVVRDETSSFLTIDDGSVRSSRPLMVNPQLMFYKPLEGPFPIESWMSVQPQLQDGVERVREDLFKAAKPKPVKVKIEIRYFSETAKNWFETTKPFDRTLIHEYVTKVLLSKPVTMPRINDVEFHPIRLVRRKDERGTVIYDLMWGLLAVVVRPQDDEATFPLKWCVEKAEDIDPDMRSVLVDRPTDDATYNDENLSAWLELRFREHDRAGVEQVYEALMSAKISTVSDLVAIKEERLDHVQGLAPGDADFLVRVRSVSNVGSKRGAPLGVFEKPKKRHDEKPDEFEERLQAHYVKECANLHKVRRFFYYHTDRPNSIPWLHPEFVAQGVRQVKKEFKNEALMKLLVLRFLAKFQYGTKIARGVLFYGPPGTGKTTLTNALCEYCGITLVEPMVTAGELNKPHIGESEKLISDIFHRADELPHLLCAMAIDEIDSAVPKRDDKGGGGSDHGADKVSVFLGNIEGGSDIKNLILIGATNRRESCDEAVRRRMSVHLYVGYQNRADRRDFIKARLLDAPIPASQLVLQQDNGVREGSRKGPREFFLPFLDVIVDQTVNFSGAAVGLLCTELLIVWSAYFVSPRVDPRWLLRSERTLTDSAALTAPPKRLKDYLQSSHIADAAESVCESLDIKIGTRTVPQVMQRPGKAVVAPYALHAAMHDVTGFTGLVVVRVGGNELQLQMERRSNRTGGYNVCINDLRPYCEACDTYGALVCEDATLDEPKLHFWVNEALAAAAQINEVEQALGDQTGDEPPIHGAADDGEMDQSEWETINDEDTFRSSAFGRRSSAPTMTWTDSHGGNGGDDDVDEDDGDDDNEAATPFGTDCDEDEEEGAADADERGLHDDDADDEDQDPLGRCVMFPDDVREFRGIDRATCTDSVTITRDHVVRAAVEIMTMRQLTRLILLDMLTFVTAGASEETKLLEELTVKKREATAPGSRTLLVLDLDSLAGVQLSRSEGSAGSDSRSIGNSRLFSAVLEMFLDCRAAGQGMPARPDISKGECWAIALISDPYLLDFFRERTSWPLTRDEERERRRRERRDEPQMCTRCKQKFVPSEDEERHPGECAYHPSALVVMRHGPTRLVRILTSAEQGMLEKLDIEANDERKKIDKVTWLCCGGEPAAQGCKRRHHTTRGGAHLLSEFIPDSVQAAGYCSHNKPFPPLRPAAAAAPK